MTQKRKSRNERTDSYNKNIATEARTGIDRFQPPAKRHQMTVICYRDLLSALSDALLLRILAFLDERNTLVLSRVSKRFGRITSNSQLWQLHYYHRFILPRAHSIPGFLIASTREFENIHGGGQKYIRADRGSRRQEPAQGSKGIAMTNCPAGAVDWKEQFILRHGWARKRGGQSKIQARNIVQGVTATEWQPLNKVMNRLFLPYIERTMVSVVPNEMTNEAS